MPTGGAPRIRTFGALRAALARPAARTSRGMRDALLRYDGQDIMRTAGWQRFVAATPFARAWWGGGDAAPHATTLVDTDALRVRILHWRPGLVLPFHDHPGFGLVAMRVLGGSPLREHVRGLPLGDEGDEGEEGPRFSLRRELVVGDVSVIPGAGVEHRVEVKFGDMSTQTLSVELRRTA